MKTFLLILFTLLFLPLLVQANLCETRAFSSILGVESYPLALLRETKFLLNREITPAEISAIEQANHLKKDEDSSQPEGVHLRAKVQILKKVGFSKPEVRKLMESGIVWIRNLSPEEALLKALKEGKEDLYFTNWYLIKSYQVEPARILKVIQETDEHFGVFIEMLSDYGVLTTAYTMIVKNPRDMPSEAILHPNTSVLFSVSRSKKPKINREDIKILLPTREEAELKEKGFGPAWTRGLDKLNEWVAVRRQLQDLRANPRTTHIPYFADQISTHLDFAKEGLGSSISQQNKADLANLVKEAEKAILEEKVTYEWWLNFNYQISTLLSDRLPVFSLTTSSLVKARFISLFPLQMGVPTIYGEIGIITLNRAQSEGIYPLGIISQSKEVDGYLLSPNEFISHDITHMAEGFMLNNQQYSIGHRLKHKKMLDLIENGPTEQRKQAELVYFSLTHERVVKAGDILFENQSREKKLNRMANHFKGFLDRKVVPLRMAVLGKEYSDLKSEEARLQYIREHIIELFMREVSDPVFP